MMRPHLSREITIELIAHSPSKHESHSFTSAALRSPVVPSTPGKTRITIRLDNDIIGHFQNIVDRAGGGGNYQTLINDALRQYLPPGFKLHPVRTNQLMWGKGIDEVKRRND